MKKKNVIVIKEGLTDILEIFTGLEEKELFQVKVLEYDELFSGMNKEIFEQSNVVNVIIVIDPAFYKSVDEELDNYLRGIYDTAFKNLLFLYTDESYLEDNTVRNGSKHAYYLSPQGEREATLNGLILYLFKAFNECIISFRLHDYIANSFQGVMDTELLKKKNEQIDKLNRELKRQNRIDSLTSLYNRATIFDFLEQERTRTIRDLGRMDKAFKTQFNSTRQQPLGNFDCKPLGNILDHYGVLSLMLIDIDEFKKINDTYGHLQGDVVLRSLGQLLQSKEIFREYDLAGRWGGEEFLVILPDTNVYNAAAKGGPANRLVEKLATLTFGEEGEQYQVTVSIGLSQSTGDDKSKEDIIKRADTALYCAKSNGRNQLVIYEDLKK